MKNNYKTLVIALIAIVGFSSCKKDKAGIDLSAEAGTEVGTTVGDKTYLISKVKNSDTDYRSAEYDTKGRLVKFSSFYLGELENYATLAYTGNKVNITEFGAANKVNQTLVLNIGSNGYASQAVVTETEKEGPYTYTYKSTINLTHNSEGYVTKMTQTSLESSDEPNSNSETETSTTNYTYSNGNLIQLVEEYEDGDTYTEAYEYYTDKAYCAFDELDEYTHFIGKTSKNLIKKMTETDKDNNGETTYTYATSFAYTFNAQGLPNTVSESPYGSDLTIEYIVK